MSDVHGGTWYTARKASRAASAGHRRYVQGDRAFRKLLARMPEAMRRSMVEMMDGIGSEMLAEMIAAAPSRTGALRAGLSKRVSPKTMRLRVGIIGRAVARRLFYGRIINFGRKAQTVTVSRKGAHLAIGGRSIGRRARALSAGTKGVYRLRLSAIPANPFVTGVGRSLRRKIAGPRIDAFWGRALASAAQGAGDE
jgi:hypothetical protein